MFKIYNQNGSSYLTNLRELLLDVYLEKYYTRKSKNPLPSICAVTNNSGFKMKTRAIVPEVSAFKMYTRNC